MITQHDGWMDLKRRFFNRFSLRDKQFTGDNGGNALVRIPPKAEFELTGDVFVSNNTSVKMTVSCRKNPYLNFEEIDNEQDEGLERLTDKRLRSDASVRLLPNRAGYKASVYNERRDQVIIITIGPANSKHLDLLFEIVKTAKFI